MPTTWTDHNDKLLLLAIIQKSSIGNMSTAQWEEIAKSLGEGYTASGVSQRFQKKLKKLPITPADAAAAGTPKSAKSIKAKSPKTPATGNKRKNADEDEEDEAQESPSKATKKSKKNGDIYKKEEILKDEHAVKLEM